MLAWIQLGLFCNPCLAVIYLSPWLLCRFDLALRALSIRVESGEPPRLFGVEPPKPRIEAVRIVDMNSSNSWAEFAAVFRDTRQAFLDHERSRVELKALMPEDAKEAIGHGVRAKRSKSGAISFDLLVAADGHAAL